jgi:hypothetical protein
VRRVARIAERRQDAQLQNVRPVRDDLAVVAVPTAVVLRAHPVPVELEERAVRRAPREVVELPRLVEHRLHRRAVRVVDLDVELPHLVVQVVQHDRDVVAFERERPTRRADPLDSQRRRGRRTNPTHPPCRFVLFSQ